MESKRNLLQKGQKTQKYHNRLQWRLRKVSTMAQTELRSNIQQLTLLNISIISHHSILDFMTFVVSIYSVYKISICPKQLKINIQDEVNTSNENLRFSGANSEQQDFPAGSKIVPCIP